MEAAERAASALARYEGAAAHPVHVIEGQEPAEFWEHAAEQGGDAACPAQECESYTKDYEVCLDFDISGQRMGRVCRRCFIAGCQSMRRSCGGYS